ncbi:hypothetical protein FQA47_016942 [Oryzias melastigma]|uniref:Uncharacterized protein n=1 Tax=Oryzias melastigma TaxID=30732 RepID=A0A834FQW0_ORYME|nr:hypothetical protein FQA47_016942 [Oryzias melastigma]
MEKKAFDTEIMLENVLTPTFTAISRHIPPKKSKKKNARNVTFRCPLCLDKDFGCVDNGRINTKRCSLTMISRYKLEKSERSIHIIKGKILGLQSSRYGLQSVADMMEGVLF